MSKEPANTIPRPEHPRPQFFRKKWRNLNGLWDFEFDFTDSKKEQGWAMKRDYERQILVPFCRKVSCPVLAIPIIWTLFGIIGRLTYHRRSCPDVC